MEIQKFKHYEQKPCKFIFRNGKQVFGVIWEANKQQNSAYYFTSNGEFQKNQEKSQPLNGFPVNLEDVIHAELLY